MYQGPGVCGKIGTASIKHKNNRRLNAQAILEKASSAHHSKGTALCLVLTVNIITDRYIGESISRPSLTLAAVAVNRHFTGLHSLSCYTLMYFGILNSPVGTYFQQ